MIVSHSLSGPSLPNVDPNPYSSSLVSSCCQQCIILSEPKNVLVLWTVVVQLQTVLTVMSVGYILQWTIALVQLKGINNFGQIQLKSM